MVLRGLNKREAFPSKCTEPCPSDEKAAIFHTYDELELPKIGIDNMIPCSYIRAENFNVSHRVVKAWSILRTRDDC